MTVGDQERIRALAQRADLMPHVHQIRPGRRLDLTHHPKATITHGAEARHDLQCGGRP